VALAVAASLDDFRIVHDFQSQRSANHEKNFTKSALTALVAAIVYLYSALSRLKLKTTNPKSTALMELRDGIQTKGRQNRANKSGFLWRNLRTLKEGRLISEDASFLATRE
jgi:hypothetical protein